MKMCLNWKVIASLATVAVGILVVEPQLAARALPFLLLAVCPLSMLLMGGMMMGGQNATQGQSMSMSQTGETGDFTCPMHADVRNSQPGRCPKCGMNLVPAAPALPAPTSTPIAANRVLTRKEQLALVQAQIKSVAAQQAELAQQVEQLQAGEESTAPNRTLAEAELVAQAADNRPVRRS
jgi:hypothetical protein